MPAQVPQPGFYYHYKHDPAGPVNNYAYEVLGVIFHTEEARPGEEHFVVYRPLYESASVYRAYLALNCAVPCFDGRPLVMWMGTVERDGATIQRFQRVENPTVIGMLQQFRAHLYR
jgi:hypothetical protein